MTDDLPTARNTLPNGSWLCLFVWCKACFHRGPAGLQAIIDAGLGDKPLKDLRFRCAKCGSRLTDHVMMGKGSVGVQPWRGTKQGRGTAAGLRTLLACRGSPFFQGICQPRPAGGQQTQLRDECPPTEAAGNHRPTR